MMAVLRVQQDWDMLAQLEMADIVKACPSRCPMCDCDAFSVSVKYRIVVDAGKLVKHEFGDIISVTCEGCSADVEGDA